MVLIPAAYTLFRKPSLRFTVRYRFPLPSDIQVRVIRDPAMLIFFTSRKDVPSRFSQAFLAWHTYESLPKFRALTSAPK